MKHRESQPNFIHGSTAAENSSKTHLALSVISSFPVTGAALVGVLVSRIPLCHDDFVTLLVPGVSMTPRRRVHDHFILGNDRIF